MEPRGLELLHGDVRDPWVGGPDDPMTASAITLLLIRGMAVCDAARSAYQPSGLRLWEQTAARFVDLAARIMVLSATVRSDGGAKDDVPVPAHFQLSGKRLKDIEHWCTTTDQAVPQAWRVHQERTRAKILRRLTRQRPSLSREILTAARALTGQRDPGTSLRAQQVRRRFESMALEASAEGVQDALETGARAMATTSRVAAHAYADELITVVRTVNAETARRQTDRLFAARYLLVLDATTLERYAHGRSLIARLGQVLAGEVRLDGDVHDACERLCAALEADAWADRLSDLLQGSLTERGLTVRIDRESAAPAIVLSAFERGTATGCGSLVVDDGGVLAEPPHSPRRASASMAFVDAVEHFRWRLGTAVSSTLGPPALPPPQPPH